MAEAAHAFDLAPTVALLAAGVVAAPLFKRVGLGSVLGYLAAGLAIGPYGFGLFTDPQAIIHVAELGVVMFLFIIGLEMQPSKLWGLRKEIFGLGFVQAATCGALLTAAALLFGKGFNAAFVAALGFVLTSTAVVMRILDERGDANRPSGQRNVAILLFEDLSIVPLLAIVAFMAPSAHAASIWEQSRQVALAVAVFLALLLVGRYLLNPLFRLLAEAHAREVMTAAALLVVLGAALAMQMGGLSMAMGAFVAGVLLSESSFRHQLEADIEPFRGILLGLFFMGVGMALDLAVVAQNWQLIAAGVVAFMSVKGAAVYLIARLFKSDHAEALTRAFLFAQGGEFAFVLYAAAAGAGIISQPIHAQLSAAIIFSMALTPLLVIALPRLLPKPTTSMEDVEDAKDLRGNALVIGWGRIGQVITQALLARGVDVSIIDTDTELIQIASDFGMKVYYGDGSRLDILHAAGAHEAQIIIICVDKAEDQVRIAELVHETFPLAKVIARAFDRQIAVRLAKVGVDFQIREAYGSAVMMSREALKALGASDPDIREVMEDIRRRDDERFALNLAGDIYAGRNLLHSNTPGGARDTPRYPWE
ncbi:MAG: cation:proton antiporter [Hyphomonadaceae bacterium]|nr:cation:proton antiporter [Hyphomonadaceae bacterium]